MNPEVISETNHSMSPKELVIITILCEIRDDLLSNHTSSSSSTLPATSYRTDNSTAPFRSRLLDVATPQETMNIIVPYLFQNQICSDSSNSHTTTTDVVASTTTLTSTDALQVLGFLVSSNIDMIANSSHQEQQRPQFLIAASKVIKNELHKRLVVVVPNTASALSLIDIATTESTQSNVGTLYISNELVHVLVHQACTGLDMEVSQNCHDSILLLFQSPILTASSIRSLTIEGIVTVWSNAINSIADQMKTKQVRSEFGTICVRCTTLMVDIILLNDTRTMELLFLEASSPTNNLHVGTLLCSLLTDLPDDDPLLQISIYDVLYKLATEHPYHPIRTQWLFQDAFIQPLLRKVGVGNDTGEESQEPDLYLGSSALRILIAICRLLMDTSIGNDTEAVTIGDTLIRHLHMALRNFEMNGNELDRLAYIDAISSLASTSAAALHMVLDDPVTCEGWLRLNVAQPKIKAAILVSVANVLDRPNALLLDGIANSTLPLSSPTVTSNEICMKLFASLGRVNGTSSGINHTDTTELLLKLVRSPIPEIRFGAYRLFESISKYSTGGQVLMTNSNFYANFLMQRDTIETTYEGRILKYNIVQALYDNSTLKQLLSNDIVTQLDQYLSQGPHYKKALQWDVMTLEQ